MGGWEKQEEAMSIGKVLVGIGIAAVGGYAAWKWNNTPKPIRRVVMDRSGWPEPAGDAVDGSAEPEPNQA